MEWKWGEKGKNGTDGAEDAVWGRLPRTAWHEGRERNAERLSLWSQCVGFLEVRQPLKGFELGQLRMKAEVYKENFSIEVLKSLIISESSYIIIKFRFADDNI